MADALGVSAFHGDANVKRQVLGRYQPHCDFTGVQADVHLGIDAVQIVEHGHVLGEVVDGHVPVFRHHQIEPNEMRVG